MNKQIKEKKRKEVEQKIQSRELRSTRRKQMQENEKETRSYTGLRSGRSKEKDMA